jgi:hypothetical protein
MHKEKVDFKHKSIIKTRKKVVHKNVSQGYYKVVVVVLASPDSHP